MVDLSFAVGSPPSLTAVRNEERGPQVEPQRRRGKCEDRFGGADGGTAVARPDLRDGVEVGFRDVSSTMSCWASKNARVRRVGLLVVGRDLLDHRRTSSGAYHRCGLSPALAPTRSPMSSTVRAELSLAATSLLAQASYPTPLTITTRALAMVRPSAAVGS